MSTHPFNLAVRFILELVALYALGYWGWTQHQGPLRFVFAFGLPLLAAVLRGTFNVPDDPSRSGKAPVPVPGVVRLLLELALFVAAVVALYAADKPGWAALLGGVALIHYGVSYDRIAWLLKR